MSTGRTPHKERMSDSSRFDGCWESEVVNQMPGVCW